MNFKSNGLVKALLCVGFGILMTGCQASYIKSAALTASVQGGNQYGDLSTSINPQNLIFPTMNLTILDPHNQATTYGTVTLTPGATAGALATLDMSVNLTAVAHIPAGVNDETMPNSLIVPYAPLIVPTELTFPFGGGTVSNSKAYVSLDNATKSAAFGVALAIKEFVTGVPGYLFVPFSANGINGIAGVFTGAAAGQSGFALFADVSALVNGQPPTLQFFAEPNMTTVKPIASSKASAETIVKMLQELNTQHAHLTVMP